MIATNLKTEYKVNPIGLGCSAPRLSWSIESEDGKRGLVQTSYRIKCAASQADLINSSDLLWDSGIVQSESSTHVEYKGKPLESGQRVYWRVVVAGNDGLKPKWSESSYWEMGILDNSEWVAKWIETGVAEDVSDSVPCPYLRHSVCLEKDVVKAVVYISALGLYELRFNGQKVGDQLFTPGWTSYEKRVQYQVFDITTLVRKGENVVGAILGDGWYRSYFGWEGKKNLYGEKTALMAQIRLSYTDGSTGLIKTDGSWKSSTGPILKSDIYNGETYDARLEVEGWDKCGFDDSAWISAVERNAPDFAVVPTDGAPVRITQILNPVEKIITPKGELLFDFGQNMVGWVQISLEGRAGSHITIDHGEVLDKDGNFYNENMRTAKTQDTYIFKGEGVETWEPRFTFHGFRYVRISGYEGNITADKIEGHVIHSEMEKIGDFVCSDTLLNRLQKNIDWGLRGNFLDVPTDCPQRDERLGWTGDAQVFASTACFIRDTSSFYTKWMKDFPLDQKPDGSVPWVVPNMIVDGGGTGWSDGFGATGWSDAVIVIPWNVYLAFGDKRILETQYESMKAWVEYMIVHSADRYIFDFGFHFGDWLAFAEYMSYNYNSPDYGYAGAYTEKELIATAYFYYSTGLMQKVATILGRSDDEKRYSDIRPKIKEAFQREFITQTGRITSNSQCAYTLALAFGLYDEQLTAEAARRLAADVSHFEHLTTGFMGTPLICQALSDNGYADLAYMLLFNKRYPSWLYSVTKGATTIWERWDCIKPDGSFQDVGMNSFNHYAYGSIGNWLYTQVAGINIDQEKPGYKHVIIKPLITDRLSFVEAWHKSIYGVVSSRWERSGNNVWLIVEVPVNTVATVYIPVTEGQQLKESGISLSEVPDVTVIGETSDHRYMKISIGSGKYIFR